jgi:hypothetical protein
MVGGGKLFITVRNLVCGIKEPLHTLELGTVQVLLLQRSLRPVPASSYDYWISHLGRGSACVVPTPSASLLLSIDLSIPQIRRGREDSEWACTLSKSPLPAEDDQGEW